MRTIPPLPLILIPALLAACNGDKQGQGDGGVSGGDGADGAGDGADGAGDGQADGADAEPVPTSIVVEVAPSGELGAYLPVTALVLDQDGAELPLALTLSADSPAATFDPLEGVAFAADGVYVVTATLPAGDGWAELSGDSAPITIDSNGPLIRLDEPVGGSWPDAASTGWPAGGDLVLSGQVIDAVSAIAALTLNGDPVELEPDGSFSVSLPAAAGLAPLRLDAVDADGNTSDRVVGVARGPVLPLAVPLDPAVALNLSQAGVEALAAQVSGTVTEALVLEQLVANNPLYSGAITVSGIPLTLTVSATGVSWDSLSPGVRLSEGALGIDLTVTDLRIDTNQRVRFAGTTQNIAGAFTDTSTTISMDLALSAPARGDVAVSWSRAEVTFTSPAYNSGGYTIPTSFGLDFEAILSPMVAPLIADYTVAVLEEQLEAIALDTPLDLLGAPVDFSGAITALAVGPDGIAIGVDGELTGGSVDPAVPAAPGSLGAAGPAPTPGESAAELSFALSPALINRVMHAAWQSGVFEISLTDADLGLEPALIELMFPGAESLRLDLSARLPPALRADAGAFGFDLVQMELACSGRRGGVDEPFVDATLHLGAPVTLSAGATGAITAEIGAPEVIVDVLEIDGVAVDLQSVAAAEALEVRLAAVAGAFVGDLIPDLDVFIPEVPGFSLRTEAVGAAGADLDWVRAECSL